MVFDLSIAHDRFESSNHVLQNGLLTHPQDLDGPLRVAAQRKINAYGQQYADNQNISFLPAIMSTSCRMHGEFLRLLFQQLHCAFAPRKSEEGVAVHLSHLPPFWAAAGRRGRRWAAANCAEIYRMRVCVYYCSTYSKAVRVGGGG